MPDIEFWKNESNPLPPCQFYVSVEVPDCGEPAPWGVLVKTKVSSAVVDMCDEHKALHERRLAALQRRAAAAQRHRQRAALAE